MLRLFDWTHLRLVQHDEYMHCEHLYINLKLRRHRGMENNDLRSVRRKAGFDFSDDVHFAFSGRHAHHHLDGRTTINGESHVTVYDRQRQFDEWLRNTC